MKENKNNKKIFLIIFIVLFILFLILYFLLVKFSNNNTELKDVDNEVIQNNVTVINNNSIIIKELENMKERERMEYYFGVFLEYVEDGKYEEAYNLLNISFKEKYFPTVDEFENYCKKTFSDMMNVKHTNIERNGDIYVLWVEITDAINGTKDSSKEINVIIKENDYYDFEMSFSVI